MKSSILSCALLLSCSFTLSAHAQDTPDPRAKIAMAVLMAKLDTNRDGKISRAEFARGTNALADASNGKSSDDKKHSGKSDGDSEELSRLAAHNFDLADTNHDGYLDKEELANAQQRLEKIEKGLQLLQGVM